MSIGAAILDQWTLQYLGVEKALKDWGADEARLTINNQAADLLVLECDGDECDTEPRFAYLGVVTLRDPDGVVQFVGHRIVPDRSGATGHESVAYHFAGPWDYLDKTPFGQPWKNWESGAEVERNTSHIIVPGVVAPGGFAQITTGAQIQEVLAFCIARNGAVMQAGNITPSLYLPLDEKTDLRCGQVIQLMLGLSPAARCYFDYTTTPPTFHCIERAQMTEKTIALSEERITALRFRDRDDFKPSCVAIFYERTDTIDGQTRTVFPKDIYPVDKTGFEYGALTQTVKLEGAVVTHVTGYVETVPIPLDPDEAWFTDHNLPASGSGARSNFLFQGSDGNLPNEIVDGHVMPWMEVSSNVLAEVFKDRFYCSYETISGVWKQKGVQASIDVPTTDLDATGGVTFNRLASVLYAEQPVAGVAQAIYEGLSEPAIEGPVTLMESECSFDVTLAHLINLSGGTGRYAKIKALPQSIGYALVAGTTTLQLGPPAHLGLSQILDLQRMNRSRRTWTNPSVQEDGAIENGSVELGGTGAGNNTATDPGTPEGPTVVDPSAPTCITLPATAQWLVKICPADALGHQVRLREVPILVKQADGSCAVKHRIELSSEIY